MIRRLLAIVLALAASTLSPATTLAQKALVYCPVGVDASGCAQVANALRGSFPGGVDRGYDGSAGTIDLMKADLDHYAVIVVPSLADNVKTQPYAVLRAAAARLRMAINGQVAVYAGTPDLGSAARNEKDRLIQQLALWAASGKRFETGLVGLVAFQDLSEEAGSRFDWVKMISPVVVSADAEVQSFGAVQPLPGAPGVLGGVSGYANMASFGLHVGAGSAARTIASAVGDGGTRPVVLVTYSLANAGTMIGTASGASRMVAAGVYTAGGGIAKSTDGSSPGATLTTDKSDYIPGEVVTFIGAGWGPGDTVRIVLHEDPRWTDEDRVVTAIADDQGSFTNATFVVDEHDFLVTFTATATGNPSGLTAQATFTDGTVKFQTSLTSPDSASFSWTLHGDATSDCTGTVTASGMQKVSGGDVSLSFAGNSGYMQITTTVPAGFSFQSWTIEGNNVPIVGGATSTTVCFGVKTASRAKANFSGLAATTLSVATASGSYGGTVNLSATLTSGGSPLAGQTVSFTLNGTSAGSATTNASGVASVSGANLGTIAPNTYATGVGASFAGATGYAGSTGSNTLTVSKASQTITFAAIGSITYGDAAPTLNASASSGLAVSFATSSAACSVTTAGVVTINGAGTCEIVASQAGNANYDAATSVSRSFTIGQAATIATADAVTATYDGATHAGTGSCSAGGAGSAGTYSPGGTAPTDAGHYTFVWSCPGDANHGSATANGTIDISQAASTVTVVAPGGEFSGSEIGATATVTGAGGLNQPLAVSYAGRNSTTYGPTATAPTHAGDYTASATFAGDANHTGNTGSADFTITKAASVTTVTCSGSPTYDGTAQTPCSVSVTGVGGLSLTPAPDYANNVNAGTATASYSFAGDADHSASSDAKTFTILKASSSVSVVAAGGVYTGSGIGATATATGAGGLSVAVDVSYSGRNSTAYGPTATAPVHAGDYTASATFAGDANHTGSSNSADFSITKASSTTTITCPATVTYSGSAQTPCSVSVTGAGSLSLSPAPDYSNNLDAGTATASYTFAGDGDHTGSSDTKTFTILKANATIVVTPYDVTYDNASHTATGTATGVVSENLGLLLNLAGTTHTDVGSYSDSWTFAGNSNYNSSSGSVNDIIRADLATCSRNGEATSCYTGQKYAWTPTATASTATLLLSATIVDGSGASPGDIRTGRVSFGLRNGTTVNPISGAQNLPVGLANAGDLTTGTASVSTQLSLNSNDICTYYTGVVMVGGNYNKPNPPWEDIPVSVCRATPGSILSNPPAEVVPGTVGGVLNPTNGAIATVQFDVKYNKSGTNPQGKVKLTIVSNRNRDGVVETGSHHIYIITSNAISALSVNGQTANFSAKANVVEEVANGDGSVSMVQLDGGALIQLALDSGAQSIAVAVNKSRSLGGNWFISQWDGKQAVMKVVNNAGSSPITLNP